MTKTSIKLKFRSSSVADREGTLYFQIIHDRVVRQLATGYRIFDDEWSGAKSMIVCGSDATRNQVLTGIRDSIRWNIERLNRIINDLDKRGYELLNIKIENTNYVSISIYHISTSIFAKHPECKI
jgi:hypothetical protein